MKRMPDNYFDGVFANAALFHVPGQELPRVLLELHASLKPGGVLFSSNPHGNNEEGWNGGRYGVYYCRCARSVPISREMNADLPSLDQLRSNAAECIRLAEAARTSQHKSLFIEMADRWLTLAEHATREDRLNGGSLFRDR